MSTLSKSDPNPADTKPIQEIWSEQDYLNFDGNRLIEFTCGKIEVLPMPTLSHQLTVQILYSLLSTFVAPARLGTVVAAPYRLRIREGAYREPDLLFALADHRGWLGEPFALAADMVMEVVSPDRPDRDRVLKREEYARAGVQEYWIVDPWTGTITVLTLAGASYAVHGEFAAGARATSRLLAGFEVDVARVLSPLDSPTNH